jgi:hypothetical protein
MSEWFGFSLAVLMIACVANGVHDDRPPTGIERVIAAGSIGIVFGWFFIKSWSMWRVRGAKPH